MQRYQRLDFLFARDGPDVKAGRQLRRGNGFVQAAGHVQRAQELRHKAVLLQQSKAGAVVGAAAGIQGQHLATLLHGAAQACVTPGDHFCDQLRVHSLGVEFETQVVIMVHESKADQLCATRKPQPRILPHYGQRQEFLQVHHAREVGGALRGAYGDQEVNHGLLVCFSAIGTAGNGHGQYLFYEVGSRQVQNSHSLTVVVRIGTGRQLIVMRRRNITRP